MCLLPGPNCYALLTHFTRASYRYLSNFYRINGKPSCANKWLLETTLRKSWNFKGMVTGDSGAVADIFSSHHYTSNLETAVIDAISAGTDVQSAGWKKNQPWATGGAYADFLPGAVRAKLINESVIDDALRHTVGLRFRLGLFDPVDDQPYWHVSKQVVAAPAHVALSRDATAQGLVLLRNEGNTLPLSKYKKTVAIGPLANARETLIGNYMGQICPDDGDGVENFNCVQSMYEGLGNASHATTAYSPGLTSVLSNSTDLYAEAFAAVQAAEQVVLYLVRVDRICYIVPMLPKYELTMHVMTHALRA